MGVDARIFAAVDEWDHIEWHGGHRWFSADYPRGHWPTLRQQITTLMAAFPDYPVYYAPDWADWNTRNEQWEITPERLHEFDEQWAEWEKENRK